MKTEAVSIVELWTGMKMYIPVKERKQAAGQFIALVDDAGLVDMSAYAAELYGICDVFDNALQLYCEEHGLFEETDEDMWDE